MTKPEKQSLGLEVFPSDEGKKIDMSKRFIPVNLPPEELEQAHTELSELVDQIIPLESIEITEVLRRSGEIATGFLFQASSGNAWIEGGKVANQEQLRDRVQEVVDSLRS